MSGWKDTINEFLLFKHEFPVPPATERDPEIIFGKKYNDCWIADTIAIDITGALFTRAQADDRIPEMGGHGWHDQHTFTLADKAFHLGRAARENGVTHWDDVVRHYIDAVISSTSPEFNDKVPAFEKKKFKCAPTETKDAAEITGAELLKQALQNRSRPPQGPSAPGRR